MDDYNDLVSSYYDRMPDYEWERMDRHRTEHALTWRALETYLPPAPAKVLDCGGGPGRYAIELARRGYSVTLFDLSHGNLEVARARAHDAGSILTGIEQGNATNLSRFPDQSFDAVLLMGPLYHLLEEADRIQALTEARRVLRPGGALLAAFISRYALFRQISQSAPERLLQYRDRIDALLETGRVPPIKSDGAEFVSYLAHPSELRPLFSRVALEIESIWALEGVSAYPDDAVNALQGGAWEEWEKLNARLASDPHLFGSAAHLLVVARRPIWRTVLAGLASTLNATGWDYTLVGGASAAVHGVSLEVNDLDLEMDASGAQAFGERFADRCILPVDRRESDIYRSYFGIFDFNGVRVEVMGDMERRTSSGWRATSAQTQELVQVEGVPVKVSWLEEETLAYLRRGRLERASRCLPFCDPQRLGKLLSGEQRINVL